MTRSALYRVAADVAWVDSVEGQRIFEPVDGIDAAQQPEAWIVRLPDGQPLSLNGSGLAIWRACSQAADDGGATVSDITARVRLAVGVEDVPEQDVADFLAELARRGLVEQVSHGERQDRV